MDAVTLARIQFATNISFHILFPTITIALGWVLFYFRLQHRRTRNEAWLVAYRLWVKVFALSFALGVVSGVTMSFQFGTNWPGFMERVGNIAGPLLAYEVLTAFFLEATFLAIMLFGIGRVSERVHTTATLLVAGGTTLSAFWILALNSWMQTPAGHEMRDGHLHAVDWFAIVFNPSMPYRVVHMLLASGPDGGLPGRRDLGLPLAARRSCRRRSAVAALRLLARRGADPAADPRRRPARQEHRGAPAGQGRGDGGPVGHDPRRPAAAVRGARRKGAREPLRDRDPERREPDHHPPGRRPRAGPERLRGPSSAGRAGVLVVSRDGGHRRRDARRCRGSRPGGCAAATARCRSGCCACSWR